MQSVNWGTHLSPRGAGPAGRRCDPQRPGGQPRQAPLVRFMSEVSPKKSDSPGIPQVVGSSRLIQQMVKIAREIWRLARESTRAISWWEVAVWPSLHHGGRVSQLIDPESGDSNHRDRPRALDHTPW